MFRARSILLRIVWPTRRSTAPRLGDRHRSSVAPATDATAIRRAEPGVPDRRLAGRPSTNLPPRRRAPGLVILLLIGVAFALSACVGGAGASPSLIRISHPDTLNGTTWTAVLVSGVVPIAGREPTAMFDATSVSGTTGCNTYGGSYQYAAGALAFGPLMSTKIGCEPPITAMEQHFAAALEGATTASIDETGRLVVDGPTGSITFEVAPVLQPA